MPYLYDMVPPNMVGDKLVSLNQLGDIARTERFKYEDHPPGGSL